MINVLVCVGLMWGVWWLVCAPFRAWAAHRERLTKIAAGIDPDTNKPYRGDKP